MKKVEKRPRGAPTKEDKFEKNGFRKDQNKWLKGESEVRGLPAIYIVREALDWYITAKETKRGTVDASKQFDNSFNEGGDVQK